jgi:hypothetical protein
MLNGWRGVTILKTNKTGNESVTLSMRGVRVTTVAVEKQ